MKSIILLASFLILGANAQRPSYAGRRPVGQPDLATRFKDQENDTSAAAPVNQNRFGEDGTTIKIPVDARGDSDLVNRLNQWPREHQPFWLLNSEAIEASRTGQPTNLGVPLNSRSSFVGQGNVEAREGTFSADAARGGFQNTRPTPPRPSQRGMVAFGGPNDLRRGDSTLYPNLDGFNDGSFNNHNHGYRRY